MSERIKGCYMSERIKHLYYHPMKKTIPGPKIRSSHQVEVKMHLCFPLPCCRFQWTCPKIIIYKTQSHLTSVLLLFSKTQVPNQRYFQPLSWNHNTSHRFLGHEITSKSRSSRFPGQPAWPFSWPLDQRLYLNWIGGSWDREDLRFFVQQM